MSFSEGEPEDGMWPFKSLNVCDCEIAHSSTFTPIVQKLHVKKKEAGHKVHNT